MYLHIVGKISIQIGFEILKANKECGFLAMAFRLLKELHWSEHPIVKCFRI